LLEVWVESSDSESRMEMGLDIMRFYTLVFRYKNAKACGVLYHDAV